MSTGEALFRAFPERTLIGLTEAMNGMDIVDLALAAVLDTRDNRGQDGIARIADLLQRIESIVSQAPSAFSRRQRIDVFAFMADWRNRDVVFPLCGADRARLEGLKRRLWRRRAWTGVKRFALVVPLMIVAVAELLAVTTHFALKTYETKLRIDTMRAAETNNVLALPPSPSATSP